MQINSDYNFLKRINFNKKNYVYSLNIKYQKNYLL